MRATFAAAFQDVGELLEKSGEALRRTRDQERVHVEIAARAVTTSCQREVVCRNGEWVDTGNRRVRDSDAPMTDVGGLTGDLVLDLGDADALAKVQQLMQSMQTRLRELMDADQARADFATRCH